MIEGYPLSIARGFLAACIVYSIVILVQLLQQVGGQYAAALTAGGTGILLGMVFEFLRRRRL